jgi:hypothetical protein
MLPLGGINHDSMSGDSLRRTSGAVESILGVGGGFWGDLAGKLEKNVRKIGILRTASKKKMNRSGASREAAVVV